ncbi:hypothetical protein L208DRAFT_1373991 [Tricholoma matsutake]|nr:hypothetical protein L208DRAFT_1373991 [Tricholoma matsutake 945]
MINLQVKKECITVMLEDSLFSSKSSKMLILRNEVIYILIRIGFKNISTSADAYLAWKHNKAGSLPQNAPSAPVELMGDDPATSTHHQDLTWQIMVIDFHSTLHLSMLQPGCSFENPEPPSLHENTSLIPRKSHLTEQLSSSYDCYLEMLHAVDVDVQQALCRGGDWSSRNLCPPSSSWADDHASMSSQWLKPEEVDQFKDEVINSHQNLSVSLGGTPQLPNTTPDAGTSTTPKNHSSPSPPGFNQDAGDDNITWLNITENGEAQQVIDDEVSLSNRKSAVRSIWGRHQTWL